MLELTSGGRRYGARDFVAQPGETLAKFTRSAPLAPIVDLGSWDGPVKDQGQKGSCTGQSSASVVEWIWRKYYKKAPVLSADFMYTMELKKDGNFPEDAGSSPLTSCRVLNETGVCLESDMPYDPRRVQDVTPEQTAAAADYRLGGYHLLRSLDDYLTCFADATPWCPVVAFDVYESFESAAVANTGLMPVPDPGERLLGGHQVKASGYHLPNRMALMQNSWGKDWGVRGYFWMPFEVLRTATCRVIHPGHW